MTIHEKFMRRTLRLALKAKGKTSPNPLVGALVVRNREIIGKGFHRKAGLPHAEIIALEKAKGKTKDAVLYVTLEPCSTYGRTPPCVDRILEAKIKRVIIGMLDPNPVNRGKAIKILKKNNVDVKIGFLEEEIKKINEPFIKYVTKRLPFVTVKVGQSLDGKIATRKGESKWITSEKSRDYAKRLRRFYDAIMVGVNTVIRDNSELRDGKFKVIVDSNLRIPLNTRIFSKNPKSVIIATSKDKRRKKREKLEKMGVRILEIREKNGRVDLLDLLERLAKLEITNILVEGGGKLIGSLFDRGLVDKVMFFISTSKIIGGKDAISSVEGEGIANLKRVIRLKDVKTKRLGEDILVEGYVHRYN